MKKVNKIYLSGNNIAYVKEEDGDWLSVEILDTIEGEKKRSEEKAEVFYLKYKLLKEFIEESTFSGKYGCMTKGIFSDYFDDTRLLFGGERIPGFSINLNFYLDSDSIESLEKSKSEDWPITLLYQSDSGLLFQDNKSKNFVFLSDSRNLQGVFQSSIKNKEAEKYKDSNIVEQKIIKALDSNKEKRK